ncbi:MAG: hypothetical protein ABS92_11965 [Thiobacillus sp. SCN 63-374]|nr:MAG: hypothetical protein ABS92_11965 [Thiobacillus sp. SCN 63-374]
MQLGIVITDERHLAHANGLLDAALARGWDPQCFLTDSGVKLLADVGFVGRALVGGQYQDAELVKKCDKVLVF